MINFGTLFFLFFTFFLIYSSPSASSLNELPVIIKEIIIDAREKKISTSRAWKKLLHIERNAVGIKVSQVTDQNFFLSNEVSFDGYEELEATLLSFHEPAEKFEKLIDPPRASQSNSKEKIRDHSQHPICRFPARLSFLKKELNTSVKYWESLPKVDCVYQKIFLNALQPVSVSFVFSSYYSDSPGSAFGHTFFRINKNSKSKQELLDYGVGYAANVTVSNGFLYAMFGLFGGFTGSWTNVPYYYKVREYNDFEARDLWSYDLNLTSDEVNMLVLHLWEVGAHFYTYYFFSQNCAYHMLTILEAAAPRLDLIQHVPFYYVIPSDSIKALFYESNLVKDISFRPSIRRAFIERYNLLDSASKQEFKNYIKTQRIPDSFDSLSNHQQALFLDAAIDLFDLKNPKQFETDAALINEKIKQKLLIERSKVNFISQDLDISPDLTDEPTKSHGSSRLGVKTFTKKKDNFTLLSYRFALHDLLDYQVGLPRNSQLEFFNISAKIKAEKINLEEVTFFKVKNLNPINFFESKPSWGAEVGVINKTKSCTEVDRCYLFGSTIKYGFSKPLFEGSSLIYWGMGTLNLRYGEALKNSRDYLAPGAELGILYRFSDQQSILANYMREFPYKRSFDHDYSVEYRFSLMDKYQLGFFTKNDYYGILANLYL